MREQFPALASTVNGKPLVYLDSAATTLKPNRVIERLTKFMSFESANVHRGAHWLSDQATEAYEASRSSVAKFINASPAEVIWTYGTTDAINFLATSLGKLCLETGDEILLTEMEHHSNIVPWQQLAESKGLVLKYIPLKESGDLDLDKLDKLVTDRTKVASFVHISNALGTLNDIQSIIEFCRSRGIYSIVDAAQSAPCMALDVKKIDCDFLVFSAHKAFGPFGVGVLYGKSALLKNMAPYRSGGSMISEVSLDRSSFLEPPMRFEAGTPNISGVVAFAEAVRQIEDWGFSKIEAHEEQLMAALMGQLSDLSFVKILGRPDQRKNIVSFNMRDAHASDVGQILDQMGVAVRVGHHCAQPLMKAMGVSGSIRASISVYNNKEDVERLVCGLKKAQEMLT